MHRSRLLPHSRRQKKKAKIQNEGQHLGWKKVNNLAFLLLLPSVLILYLFSDHLLGFRFEKNRCSMLPTFCCLYNCRLFSQLFLRLPSLLLPKTSTISTVVLFYAFLDYDEFPCIIKCSFTTTQVGKLQKTNIFLSKS